LTKQHLNDPDICIRCNTCEENCPVHAVVHDDSNYVVKADVFAKDAWSASRPLENGAKARIRRERTPKSRIP
jgi:formate hydrogenlyase subunit 6/NADH:ubiquinone oxidoreductase subunit I